MIASILFNVVLQVSEPMAQLTVYTYDSMVAKESLGNEIFPLFEKKYSCKLKIVASGDAVQMLSRIELERETESKTADVLLGVDQILWDRAKKFSAAWKDWKPKSYERIKKEVQLEGDILPFDYGVLTFMSDQIELDQRKLPAPKSLKDLLRPEWKRNFILEDPRTSSPGLVFLLMTRETLGSEVWSFWKNLKTQWLTLAKGWDAAYGLFLKAQAPLVWSYTTSEAYHESHGDKGRYKAVILEEGNPLQIEGAVIVKGLAPNKFELAQDFLNFLISDEVQLKIPKTQWMFPVTNVRIPPEFTRLPQPKKNLKIFVSAKDVKEVYKDWNRAISGL